LVILATLVIFVTSTYELAIGPAIHDISQSQIESKATGLENRIQSLLRTVENTLETAARYVVDDIGNRDDLDHFNQVFRPLIENTPEIAAVLVVEESGRASILKHETQGNWVNFITDPAVWGAQARWLTRNPGGEIIGDEMRYLGFDARTRVWYKGAMTLPPSAPRYWTQPYVFYSDREPGITVAKRVKAGKKTFVVAIDVRLRDILTAISQIKVGNQGRAILIFEPGYRVADDTPAADAPAMGVKPNGTTPWGMRLMANLTSPPIVQGFQAWQRRGSPADTTVRYTVSGTRWLGYFHPITIGAAQPHWLGLFAPRDDFMPTSAMHYLILVTALIGGSLALALGLATWLGKRRFAGPLQQLMRESERLARLELRAPIDVPSSWAEVDKVVEAQEAMRRELLAAWQKLRASNAELEEKIRARTADLERISETAQRSSRLLLDMADSLPCAVFRFERAVGEPEGRFTFISRNVRDMLGVDAHDIQAKPEARWTYLLPEDKAKAQPLLHTSGDNIILERVELPDKGLRWLETRARYSAMENGGQCWNGYWLDVTAEQRMQEDLRQAKEDAEQATRVEENFIANMSHEIRTPMNAILGMTRLALQTRLDAKQRDYLGKILHSGQHLLEIINDILDFSKIEAGKLQVENVTFELESVLETVRNLVAEKAAAKGLELTFTVAPQVPPCLVGDPLRLGQVLVNYANNAVKFTERGEIAIAVDLREDMDDEVLLGFAVRDTGIGIAEADIGRLFQSFSQADVSTTRQYGGTGLGLAISKQLAELMGGEVGVESELGRGSTFWFTARMMRGDASHLAPSLPPAVVASRARVLVADDNDNARHAACDAVRAMKLDVVEAASGLATLDACRKAAAAGQPFGIVVLDWQMPDMDGAEVAQRLRAEFRENCPELLMLTVYGKGDALHELSGVATENMLIKPVGPQLLASAIARVLGGQPGGSPGDELGLAINAPNLKAIAGASILLVEDNEINRQVAREILETGGFTVDTAENGAIAVEKIHNAAGRAYDLVLMDERMPVMDGLEATRQLRARGCGIPIVALTANVMPGDRERYREVGMNDYVAKPIDPVHLWGVLCEWIKPRQGLGQGRGAAPIVVPAAAEPVELPLDVPGLDVERGLRNALGRAPLYRNLLEKFCKNHAHDSAQLETALAEPEWPYAMHLAHTLKGVAGNVGATRLQAIAAKLEAACRHEEIDEARLTARELADELSSLIERLDQTLGQTKPEAPPPETAPVERLGLVAGRLAYLLGESDAEALECLQNEYSLLRGSLQAHFGELEEAIGAFDFPRALQVLHRACDEKQIKLDRAA
jgi:signal transduction histidine kinase/CheY-like chemotaxis protein